MTTLDFDNFDLQEALLGQTTGERRSEGKSEDRSEGKSEDNTVIQDLTSDLKPVRHRRKLVIEKEKLEPAPPLLKDKNFLLYQFWGIVGAMMTLEVMLIAFFIVNVRFSLVWLEDTFRMPILYGMGIQLGVALCEQHLPRTKRFFYRVELRELWKVVRWIIWPILFIATLFDVYSTSYGLISEFHALLPFHQTILTTIIFTVVGGIIALAPEPLLVITTLAIIRLLRKQRRTLAIK